MTDRPQHEAPDWLIPGVLAAAAVLIIIVGLAILALGSSSADDDSLAGQMETWTRCLRSEGAPVPLVESLRDGGFRVTFDDAVINASFDPDELKIAFELCLDDAPEGVQRFADIVSALTSLPFGADGFGDLGGLLFELGESGGASGLGDPDFEFPPLEGPGLEGLCEQVDVLQLLMPDVADQLRNLCVSGGGV